LLHIEAIVCIATHADFTSGFSTYARFFLLFVGRCASEARETSLQKAILSHTSHFR
jgi:hypothetical protein